MEYDENRVLNITISSNEISRGNPVRSRRINFQNWKDVQAKARRNSGLAYVNRNGVAREAVPEPTAVTEIISLMSLVYSLLSTQNSFCLNNFKFRKRHAVTRVN